jgi:crossover junction endodeoxyribonuclease RuvC
MGWTLWHWPIKLLEYPSPSTLDRPFLFDLLLRFLYGTLYSMLVLGIDPGTATTGFGILRVTGAKFNVVNWGLIETSPEALPETRLASIYAQMNDVIDTYKPDVMAIEKVFFSNNAKTAIRVGQAQGVMLLTAGQHHLPLVEYAPGTIKKIVSGDGRADKKIMQQAIQKHLGREVVGRVGKKTHFDNAADALAVAICHVYQSVIQIPLTDDIVIQVKTS